MAMTIRREEPYPDEWALTGHTRNPFAGEPIFAECQAYQILRRELKRYTAKEVRGRSFLVSGHRGSGKTTLVLRAIEAALRDGPGWPRQRPLLVKLHGPSLLMRVAPSKPPTSAEPKPGDRPQGPPADSGRTITGPQPADGDGSAQAALVQIMIALYRALTDEVVFCYRRFAHQRASDGGAADFSELVGQLILELDNAPGPAVLRDFWSRVGALRQGVLWSVAESEEDASSALRRSRMSLLQRVAGVREGYGEDQGIQEVVALSTAAQAFQVVSGCIEYKPAQKGCAKEDSTRKTEINPVKDIIYPLIGVLTGGLVGGGTAMTGKTGQIPVSVGLGLATALATFLLLSWTAARRGDRSREEDHTFIHDHSIATLDRELPTVIARIRRAGLAPVFVVDELDKVKDLSKRMTELVEGLKHIVADNSFFCFLTDRAYFEELRNRAQDEAYPKEYTYFSHRLFLLYRPDDLHQYLDRLIDIEPTRSAQEQEREEIGKLALSHLLLHRAMLHAFDLQRELARVCDGAGRVIVRTGELLSHFGYRYHIMIQLAIESLLGKARQRDRLNQEPQFGQFIYDALYLPSRNWLSGAAELDLSDDKTIENRLCERVGLLSESGSPPKPNGEPKPPSGPPAATAPATPDAGGNPVEPAAEPQKEKDAAESLPPTARLVGETDRQYLIGLVRKLAQLLADPDKLVQRLKQEKGLVEEETSPQEETGSHEETGLQRERDLEEETDAVTRTPEEVQRWAGLLGALERFAADPDLRLLQPVDAQAHRYRWCRDPFGRKLEEDKRKPSQQVAGEKLLPQQQEADDRFIDRMERFLADLAGEELSPDCLASAGILLRSPDWQEVQDARRRLRQHRKSRGQYDKQALVRDQDTLREYVKMLSTCSRVLACALVAGRLLGRKSGRTGAREQAVHGVLALSKIIPFSTLGEQKALERTSRLLSRYQPEGLVDVPILTQENMDEWIASVTKAHEQAGEGPPDVDFSACRERAWRAWADRVEEFAKTGRSRPKRRLEEALCIAADGPVAASLVKPVKHLSLYEASTILWAALADMRSESLGRTPLFAGLPALYLLGMLPSAIDLFARLPHMLLGSEGQITNEEITRWSELVQATREARRPPWAIILSEGVNGITSQWLPSPSFGAITVPQEILEQALRHEVLSPALREAVQSIASSALVFVDFKNFYLEDLGSVVSQILAPLSELPYFILSREPPKQTPPPGWRVLHKTQCLDEAMKEALEVISP